MINTQTVGRSSYSFISIGLVVAAIAFSALTGTALAHGGSDKSGKVASTTPAALGMEVNIGSNGGVLVRGAKVTSVSGSQISADTSLGSSVLHWTVKTDSNTDFAAERGGQTGLAQIAVGDTISFRGTLDQSVSGLTVQAKQVKDWTVVETKGGISGVVSSINSTLGSFTIVKGNATTSVQTSSSTKFTKDGSAASFADIVLNAKVKIEGLFNASTSVVSATEVEIGDDSGNKNRFGGWFNGWFKSWHR